MSTESSVINLQNFQIMNKLSPTIQEKHPEVQTVKNFEEFDYGAGKKKKLIVFDLDGTLVESKSALDQEMAGLLGKLLEIKKVAVISGGKYELFKTQFLAGLKNHKKFFSNLFLFPTTSTAFYKYAGNKWKQVYSKSLSQEAKKIVYQALEETFKELRYIHPKKVYGKMIEDRRTQVSFSPLGQNAPINLKNEWRKENDATRLKIAKRLQKKIPNFKVRVGGITTIDITSKGIDKAYGIRQIKKHLGVSIKDMLFVGDALFPGGNDYAALRTGVDCVAVKSPEDTKKLISCLMDKEKAAD